MAHDCCEISASRGAAYGYFREVEREERGGGGFKPEEGFPAVMDSCGVGVFGC